jgi:cell division protein FtsQ
VVISRRVVLIAVGVALLGSVIWAVQKGILWSGWLPIKTVQVAGQLQWVDKEKLNTVLTPFTGANFFNADLQEIKRAVQQLPWVMSVSVRRVWPDTLRLEVREHQALARWDSVFLMNQAGQLYQPQTLPQNLVHLQGPSGMHQRVYELYQELQRTYAQYDMEISNLALNGRHALQVRLSNGIEFLFGRYSVTSDPQMMLNRFFGAYEQGLNRRIDQVERVDLRYANGFAIRWRSGSDDNNNQAGAVRTGKIPGQFQHG